ncbi:hypothetical protein F5141DRAFT_1059940 [Pisolithus sp. B1]|nr:hypothetical protein F5141DRAFT_1059940 [Pisolithus sp. B1]
MSQLTNLQRVMAAEDLPSASISSNETKPSALTVKVQCLSPEKDVTKWDIDRFAEPRPYAADKTKYFQYPQWGHISDPATVLDVHGRVMLWYLPGIIPPERVVKHSLPPCSLVKHSKRKNESSMRFGNRHVPELDGRDMDPLADSIFGNGRLMNSPETFQQGHLIARLMVSKRLQDKVYESSNLKIPAVKEWLHEISYAEEFWNSISGLVLPDLARVGKDAIAAKGDWVVTQPPSGTQWSSIYVGIDVIVNQETPPHLDKVSAPSLLDLLIWTGQAIFHPTKGSLGKLFKDLVSKVLQKTLGRGSLYTFHPTKTRRGKLTHKEVDARHLYFPSGSQPSTPGTPRAKASSQHLNFSDFHDCLDIPDSDWNDVDDAPQSRRHTKSQNDYIREWLPWRAEYLNIILEGEQLARGGICPKVEWCSLPAYLLDGPWILAAHWPWGDPCPCNWSDPDPEESGYVTGDGNPNHRLFPASISKPKTAFTFDVLDHFLIDALECKTSAMSFYQKLKRTGNGLVLGMMLGKIQEMEDFPSSALPAPSQVLIYLQTGKFSMTDGNFTAQHMEMNKPELDVALSDGKGYMVSEGPYQNHLQQSLDTKEGFQGPLMLQTSTSPTSGPQGLVPQLVLDMAALSPTLWWIFKKGRGCQWSVKFWSRVKNSPSPLLPPALEIVPAMGKVHLAAHKLSCFPRYSLNFVKDAGHLDGEILETLWAPFNKISPTARSMTQAHRQEVYDDHMRDSNWKKLVGLVLSLLKKYKTSNKCLEEMNQAYDQLTAVLDPDKVSGWELDALRAEADRGEALDIYLLKGHRVVVLWPGLLKESALRTHSKVPLELKACRDQLRSKLRQLPNPMSTSQEVKISVKRQRLSARIEKFHSNGQAFFKGLEINGAFTPQDDPEFCGKEEEEEGEEDREFWGEDDRYWEVPGEEVEELASELMSIWMPSSIGSAKLTELGLVDLLKEERELRIGQANDCLDQLRTDLGNKAMEGTRTKKEIQKVVARINKHVRGYQRARQAILRLDPNVDMAEKYQEILPNDLAVSKEVTEENRFGQGKSKLAWFWMMEGEQSQLSLQGGGLMEECNLQDRLAQSKGKMGQMERRSVTGEA